MPAHVREFSDKCVLIISAPQYASRVRVHERECHAASFDTTQEYMSFVLSVPKTEQKHNTK
jgi:hypothetical protein